MSRNTITAEQLRAKGYELINGQWTKQRTPLPAQPAQPAKPKRQPGQTAVGVMNKTEARFYEWLKEHYLDAELAKAVYYERVKLRVGDNSFYTPDFCVIDNCGELTLYEVKGAYIRDKALAKPKAAAMLYPHFKFILAQWLDGHWKFKELSPC